MNNTLTIALIKITLLFLIAGSCLASRVSNEQEEMQVLLLAIHKYRSGTGPFPTSWDDLWNHTDSRKNVDQLDKGTLFGKRTDLIESVRFLAPGTNIVFPDDKSRVVAMMTRPMRSDSHNKVRLLIVDRNGPGVSVKQISENSLSAFFSRVGLDLNDFTGPEGKWMPENRFPATTTAPSAVIRSPEPLPFERETIPPLPLSKRISEEWKIRSGIMLGLAVVLGMAFLMKRRIRS